MQGKRFGDYRVVGEIARGGQGAVIRAVRESDGTPVALKLLLNKSPKQVARFRQESRVLMRLSHPNLIRVLADGDHQGLPYLVMELVEGEDLASRLERGRPDLAWVTGVFKTIAGALQHCHEHGVVHRDVKPMNILIEKGTDRPVLVDFGLIKRDPDRMSVGSLDADGLSKTGEMRGTPAFMSPEQISPAKFGGVTPATDVYGLAATLFAVLTGEPPFEADHLPGLLVSVMGAPPRDPRSVNPDVPEAIALLCQRSLAKDPSERPESAAAFAAELEGSLAAPAPTRRWLPLALGVILAALALAVGGSLRGSPPEPEPQPAPPRAPSDPTPAQRVLSADAIAKGEREARRLERETDPQGLAEAAEKWLEEFPGHAMAQDVEQTWHDARVRFPVRSLAEREGVFLSAGRFMSWRGRPTNVVSVWSVGQDDPVKRWNVPWPVSSICRSADRRLVAVGGWGKEVWVIDTTRLEVVRRLPYERKIDALAFSSDASRLAVGGARVRLHSDGRSRVRDQFDVSVLDTTTGALIVRLAPVRAEVMGLAFVDGDEQVVVAQGTNILGRDFRETPNANNALAFHRVSDGTPTREEVRLVSRPNFVTLHPAGGFLTGTNGGQLQLYETSGRLVREFVAENARFNKTGPRFLLSAESQAIRGAVLEPGGTRLYTAGGEIETNQGSHALWDTASARQLRRVDLTRACHSIDVSSDGAWLLLGTARALELWRAK